MILPFAEMNGTPVPKSTVDLQTTTVTHSSLPVAVVESTGVPLAMVEQEKFLQLPQIVPPLSDASQEGIHVLVLQGVSVRYQLQRRRRGRLALRVDDRGLRVTASMGTSIREVESFVRTHDRWVLKKLSQWIAPQKVEEGLTVPLLGQEYTLEWGRSDQEAEKIADRLILPRTAHESPVKLLEDALKQMAMAHFHERLSYFAPLLECEMPAMKLSQARSHWGECQPGQVRLNWRLIHLPAPLVDYVVIHELCHLHEFNHGPKFWRWVERVAPNYVMLRRQLTRATPSVPKYC